MPSSERLPGSWSHEEIKAYKHKHRKDQPIPMARETHKDTGSNNEPKTPSPGKRRRIDDPSEAEQLESPSKKAAYGQTAITLDGLDLLTPTSIAKRIPLPPSPAQGTPASSVTNPAATAVESAIDLPTPTPTPKKPQSLDAIPKIADRYAPQISTLTGIDHRNPQKFSVKPGYWKPWSSKEYVTFAAHLRAQFDPEPFAQSTGRTVEEVQHVFASLVVNPLYDAAEVSRRGREGMKETMEMFSKFSTPLRFWGKRDANEVKIVSAELDCVTDGGLIKLIDLKGSEVVVRVEELSEQDVKYLKKKLTQADKKKLWADE